MRLFKKQFNLLVVTTFILLFAGIAQGQDADKKAWKETPPEERAAQLTEMMKASLQLTPEQEKPVYEIHLKYAHLMDPFMKDKAFRKSKSEEIKEMNREKEAELKEVLTEEQFTAYRAQKEEMRRDKKEKSKAKQGEN